MVILKNLDYDHLIAESANKRIALFGAGGTLFEFLRAHAHRIEMFDQVEVILDNDVRKSGKTIRIDNREVGIKTVDLFVSENPDPDRHLMLMLVGDQALIPVLEQLDAIPALDGMVCVYGLSSFDWQHPSNPPFPYVAAPLRATGNYEVPRIIHYCWFGGAPLPPLAEECVASWKKHCPDYELRLWNEGNYDVSKAPLYVRQAYEAKKYAFVSDYARLDVVHRHGGIYLDTDVELLRGLDGFLRFRAFFAFEHAVFINTGLGFACVPGDPLLKGMMEQYGRIPFVQPDGTHNSIPCPIYLTEYFQWRGVRIDNSMQMVDDALFLPSDFFGVVNQRTYLFELTDNSHGIHKFACSWFPDKERDEWLVLQASRARVNRRLLADWNRDEKRRRGIG